MNSTMMKRLFRTIQTGSGSDLEKLCRRIVEDERGRGHGKVANDLEKIIGQKPKGDKNSGKSILAPLPKSRRDSSPLVQDVPLDRLRHEMVLPEDVEKRFLRIEREFAARSRLATHGLKPRHRILLYGPPGCGKTLGAERLAYHTGLPLRKVRFDNLLSSYFGETMANLRKVFDAAEESPCALFLDECDSLARSRNDRNDVGEVTRITNALLEMLEGYSGDGLVIAATNLDSQLDSALFRRFDEVLKIPLPGQKEIQRLLKVALSSMKVESRLAWGQIAGAMDGMSGSEVVQIAENAAKHAVLDNRKVVTKSDILESLAEVSERQPSS
ncbi:MAG: AAA family ATPase [Verrucomicrobiales bacterium]|nr:AAA family ATPase [Verrucomicrobiales bacterium]